MLYEVITLINDKIGQETEDSILQTKAKYGRVINSENIKIREKGKIFENEIIPGFSQEKDYADKSRAIQELALINLTKAKNINTSLKPSNFVITSYSIHYTKLYETRILNRFIGI